ncbi:ZPR1 zinc-finger domain-containing protein [Pisolithus microcarpus]|nr:ZPR1 zinc-finger domain-containing protein [Pisolithus microcarpus]
MLSAGTTISKKISKRNRKGHSWKITVLKKTRVGYHRRQTGNGDQIPRNRESVDNPWRENCEIGEDSSYNSIIRPQRPCRGDPSFQCAKLFVLRPSSQPGQELAGHPTYYFPVIDFLGFRGSGLLTPIPYSKSLSVLSSIPDPQVDVHDLCEKCRTKSHFGVASSGGTVSGTSEEKRETDGEGAGDTDEIYEFMGLCSRCVSISLESDPQGNAKASFKDTLIISTNCEHCGYRNNEAKSGATNSENGENHPEDRGPRRFKQGYPESGSDFDIWKSETCGLTIPEIYLVLQPGTLGGRFTTVEGILEQVYEEPSEKVYMFWDSSTMVDPDRQTFQDVLKQLEEPDMEEVVTYERTCQQNEELGLNDMKVENHIAEDANEPNEVKRFEEIAT